jgi:hypothetical protein
VQAVFRHRWDREFVNVELGENDKAVDLKACGELLVRTYLEQAAPPVDATSWPVAAQSACRSAASATERVADAP